ncbi:Re/Si-specific NAD(P)(+) transhydrogenase subunit alpha [Endozoicomonas gorgoniicola]|uniref:NAD(P) transhydrogenase subunit alpha n=1 Tax=Endozoicomonas gorgoniicola TaxID=1234144 RepID=A0ABT3MP58_9GAMM|nr:Re/Si-specific NAD(P)(+) transhydrogenase subunit alpha [Endozoicomonas gorgoniicola]MCW7551149.1 Re/Si-specific NAD(P)(+) transhydrogenase subunit alpha [Endozoicomonas gorgoniicola]
MRIGIPGEIQPNENRVAATPDTVKKLIKLGYSVVVESGAGLKASFDDSAYTDAGAEIAPAKDVWQSDIVMKVNEPSEKEIALLKDSATLASFIWPGQNEALMNQLSQRNINVLALDSVPRLSRSQSLDALSSMANIGGYRAVVEASHHFGRFFNGQITAAGKIPPAKVLVIGAGVAGLAALGAAGSMGAIVRAFDTRPEVKEQVESMGAEFLELDYEEEQDSSDGYAKEMSQAFIDAEMALFMEQAKEVDIIITTALIPGRPAPRLITEDMVKAMKPGSVIVDLAALTGGNCACTEKDKAVVKHGVTVIGFTDMPSRLPTQSSQLYGTNLVNMLKLMTPEKDGELVIDFDDEVVRGLTVVKEGNITWPPPPVKVSAAPTEKAQLETAAEEAPKPSRPWLKPALLAAGACLFAWVANSAPASFLEHLTVFVLSSIVGYYVIWNVTSALHTPLMSVTNAISGIIVVGALMQMGSDNGAVLALSGIALVVAMINIVGGFAVTQRMLKMFIKE